MQVNIPVPWSIWVLHWNFVATVMFHFATPNCFISQLKLICSNPGRLSERPCGATTKSWTCGLRFFDMFNPKHGARCPFWEFCWQPTNSLSSLYRRFELLTCLLLFVFWLLVKFTCFSGAGGYALMFDSLIIQKLCCFHGANQSEVIKLIFKFPWMNRSP